LVKIEEESYDEEEEDEEEPAVPPSPGPSPPPVQQWTPAHSAAVRHRLIIEARDAGWMATRPCLQPATFAEQQVICCLRTPFPPVPRMAGRIVVLSECVSGTFVGRSLTMQGRMSPMAIEGITMAHILPLEPSAAHQLRRAMAQETPHMEDFLFLLPTDSLM
jgi:hypothetical protein